MSIIIILTPVSFVWCFAYPAAHVVRVNLLIQLDSSKQLMGITERGSDRQSDESSKKADSDSHPENWTDHEHSDPQQSCTAASPPHAPLSQSESIEKSKVEFPALFAMTSGVNELNCFQESVDREKKSRLFARERTTSGSKGKKETPKTPGSISEQTGGPVHTESSVSIHTTEVIHTVLRVKLRGFNVNTVHYVTHVY